MKAPFKTKAFVNQGITKAMLLLHFFSLKNDEFVSSLFYFFHEFHARQYTHITEFLICLGYFESFPLLIEYDRIIIYTLTRLLHLMLEKHSIA